jgi:hypothetical protein
VGDTVMVGAGAAVYLFERDAGGANAWGEVARLQAAEVEASDWFGFASALAGETALVGAFGDDEDGLNAGAAYVFDNGGPVCGPEIVNGGFESPVVAPGSLTVFPSIPGWTQTMGTGMEIQNHVAGSPFEGSQHVELDAFGNGNMIQSVATEVGRTYKLRLAYSPRPGVEAADNGIDVLFDGAPLGSLAASGLGLLDTSWSVFYFVVSASMPTSSIEFRSTGASNTFGGYLDAVSLSCYVPFTDDPLTPGVSVVRAVHIAEVRARIDALRSTHGLSAFAWTDDPIVAGTTVVEAIHMLELRAALSDAYVAAGRPAPSFTDPGLGSGAPIRTVHMFELRDFVTELE